MAVAVGALTECPAMPCRESLQV